MKWIKPLIAFMLLLAAVACNNSDSTETATISVKLVDDPGDFEHVFVEVIDVMVKYEDDSDENEEGEESEDDSESGWQSLGVIEPGVYDLLELTGGLSLQLVDEEPIEAGVIQQIRLVLGENNSIVLEGEENEEESLPLRTPSAQQSGLKVMVNQEILPGFNYDFILDFDADESIVFAGNSGNINLKPVLRASLEINSGILAGNVTPTDIAVEVTATNGELMASTFTNDMGDFEILGLPAGIYTVTITPEEASMLNAVTIENVEISVGETTTLDPIVLE